MNGFLRELETLEAVLSTVREILAGEQVHVEPRTRELLKRAGVRQTAVFVGETLRRAAEALYVRRHGREALERFNKENPTWTQPEVSAQWDRDLGDPWLRELLRGVTSVETEEILAQLERSLAPRTAGV